MERRDGSLRPFACKYIFASWSQLTVCSKVKKIVGVWVPLLNGPNILLEEQFMFTVKASLPQPPLYRQEFEHDNCGIGACVNIKGKKSRATVENALKIVENLEHRAGKDAEGKTGDGVGILTQIPHNFFVRVTTVSYTHLTLPTT